MDDEYEKFQRDVLMAAHQTGGEITPGCAQSGSVIFQDRHDD